eukprot:gnl/TRDRNA2_/TRDRNA2_125247_c0_seq1.p1 gnl/TRDRNA2_/TRDRNA2_125247_c0~~gnl/TRDRNA2_/TRDRNA2_125247_c0_seq1.p1  ORF type:complete len:276 (+),score=39.89 gnl/TRDRNA2_/TRDRNA2_125247_c0_seq1:37-864(+)
MSSARYWLTLLGVLTIVAVLVWRLRRKADEAVLWDSHRHEDARLHENFAWRDCTGRAPSGAELKRAYRRLARDAHPDGKGSNEHFRALDQAQGQLQSSPVQYNLRAAFMPINRTVDGHGIHDVRIELPNPASDSRIRMEVDFTSAAPRGFWKFGLLAKGTSSIEYSGEGFGYDMCCQFLKDSHCTYKPYGELVEMHAAHTDSAWDARYATHDCPLRSSHVYTGVVYKPLHVSVDGPWAAVLEIVDEHGMERACVAATFRTEGGKLLPLEKDKVQL